MSQLMLRLSPAVLLIVAVVVQTGNGHRSEAVAADLDDMDGNTVDIKQHGSLEDFEMRDEEIEALKMEMEKEHTHRVDSETRLLKAELSAKQQANAHGAVGRHDKEATFAEVKAHVHAAGNPDICAERDENPSTCCTRECLGNGMEECQAKCILNVNEKLAAQHDVHEVAEDLQAEITELDTRGLAPEMVARAEHAATQCKDQKDEKKDGCCWITEGGCASGMPSCVKVCLAFIGQLNKGQTSLSNDGTEPDIPLYQGCMKANLLSDASGALMSSSSQRRDPDEAKTLARRESCCWQDVCERPTPCNEECGLGVGECKTDCIAEVNRRCSGNGKGGECEPN